MIVEARTYDIAVGQVGDYVANYALHGLPVSLRHGLALAGYFGVEAGNLHQVVHYWKHDSLADRESRRALRDADPAWRAYQAGARGRVLRQEVRLFETHDVVPPFAVAGAADPHAFVEECVTLTEPGDTAAFEAEFARRLLPRMAAAGARLVCSMRGLTGMTGEVVHLWYWEGMAARDRAQAALAADRSWQRAQRETQGLTRAHARRFLRPLAISPLR
ncbi:MAG: NIPSNAP family protein [Burkholderiales bacterium]|nr:NIPSNAP family protein [Burkholderiales bacterium]